MMSRTRGRLRSRGMTPHSSRWPALYVLCAGALMIVLDVTIVNVALPSIQDDLGFSQSQLAWVVNSYLIAFGGLLLLAGRLGDLIGPRRVFLIGLAIFTGASLVCALAQSEGMLIGARFVQGAGGALTSAVVLGMIVTLFPDPREQAKAIGVYSASQRLRSSCVSVGVMGCRSPRVEAFVTVASRTIISTPAHRTTSATQRGRSVSVRTASSSLPVSVIVWV